MKNEVTHKIIKFIWNIKVSREGTYKTYLHTFDATTSNMFTRYFINKQIKCTISKSELEGEIDGI